MKTFAPSWALLGIRPPITQEVFDTAQQFGIQINPNYQGEYGEFAFSNSGCSPNENCAIFITRIPPNATKKEILDSIIEGKIFNFSRTSPDAVHDNAAAHVTFFERSAVDWLLQRAELVEGFRIKG
ncbi:uncharacterized protein LY89DRAFT_733779 [Mollisia scopiformis]|uniref:Uncharacterized protein n=1 Tax=Mollisia scopiformis TaxID=149040 RepID=A0A194X9C8_MOLSC|nr:uncharacterized protein LY89DRAFT_733779 [Mollisia scopiformis]KUJ16773.1 hypothetical protein LY89DRAFT_733779 [Mollisia scopiformis]